jgi:hypothetical protein
MEPNAEGVESDHTSLNDTPSSAKSPDGSRGTPDLPPLQHSVHNPDHDGPQDQEPHSY